MTVLQGRGRFRSGGVPRNVSAVAGGRTARVPIPIQKEFYALPPESGLTHDLSFADWILVAWPHGSDSLVCAYHIQ